MSENGYTALSSADTVRFSAEIDAYAAECDAKADMISDQECYEFFNTLRQKQGLSSISFEEFWSKK
ncbi:hypothetical protein AGMMS49991_07860 [Spirochaetia bacterium]|nr:hypothetical protein AGMMS49991_07860 [Spirochaetia bacterium]